MEKIYLKDFRGKAILASKILSLVAAAVLLVFSTMDVTSFWPLVGFIASGLLYLFSGCMKFFVCKTFGAKIAFYVLDVVLMVPMMMITGDANISIVYALMLTDFYISSNGMKDNWGMFIPVLVIYTSTYILHWTLVEKNVFNLWTLPVEMYSNWLVLWVHFIITQLAIALVRQNAKLTESNKQLEERKEELEFAYKKLADAAVMEERNRIAKDIHDNAGHSLTTVIMQTEFAKLSLENNPDEAKRAMIAANLQAKNALEQLRASVHILSGLGEHNTLKEAVEGIIGESSDGTQINIRYDVDDVKVTDAKARFICNTLKEGIANGMRHGGATAFYFELKRYGDYLRFCLSDNGSGVNMKDFKKGFGLAGMVKGAKKFGGEFNASSEPDEGFEIVITLPFKEEDDEN